MTENHIGSGQGGAYALENLPASARQAIYHYVTGKTETMSQRFRKNVLIKSEDLDNLHAMICDQLRTHTVEYGPTTTVDIKLANERAITHSSWEHYKEIRPISTDITSEVIIKMEFILDIQTAPSPQRCVVTVACDSSLPILIDEGRPSNPPLSFWYFISQD